MGDETTAMAATTRTCVRRINSLLHNHWANRITSTGIRWCSTDKWNDKPAPSVSTKITEPIAHWLTDDKSLNGEMYPAPDHILTKPMLLATLKLIPTIMETD